MPIRSPVFSILLLSADSDLRAQLKHDLADASVTAAKDLASVPRAAVKRRFDVVFLETRRGLLNDLADVQRAVDPSRTVILVGSRSVLRLQAAGVLRAMGHGRGRRHKGAGHEVSLEDYIEAKLVDFVKDMKNGSGRDLHPMLIRAVERPLISLALRETNGNQIQAAHLLGMNRNTLRKRITDLRIPIRRDRARSA